MLNDLQQIMLGIFKHHKDTLVFEDDFDQVNNIWVRKLGTQSHFAACRLGYPGVLDHFTFLVRLEPWGDVSDIRWDTQVFSDTF